MDTISGNQSVSSMNEVERMTQKEVQKNLQSDSQDGNGGTGAMIERDPVSVIWRSRL